MMTYTLTDVHRKAGKNAAYAFKAGDKNRAARHVVIASIFLKLSRKWSAVL